MIRMQGVVDEGELYVCSCIVKGERSKPKAQSCRCGKYAGPKKAPTATKHRLTKKARWAKRSDVKRWKKTNRKSKAKRR